MKANLISTGGLLSAMLLASAAPLYAQPMDDMPGMDHGTHADHEDVALSVAGSGTSRLPASQGEMTGLHIPAADWMVMVHGYAWGVYSDQGGPRGADKSFVQSMGMIDASGPIGEGVNLQLRTMLSLDPLMGDRGYPNLFAAGETAGGVPLVDRQHPHDFFMELSGRLDIDTSNGTGLFLYGGPVAEPALGPSAFMHRGSARYNPEAPISHHWFDSTHITFGVVTAGFATRTVQIEASAFRGREPDEARWDIETPKLDSWSARASWSPAARWAAQISYGRLKSPEALHADEDEGRLTASVSYAGDSVSLTAAYARKNRLPGPVLEAWLVEANYTPADRHNLFGRIEVVENDELFDDPSPLHGVAFRLGKFTGGYAYRFPLGNSVDVAVGGSASLYAVPSPIEPFYGRSPKSFTLFAKLSLGS